MLKAFFRQNICYFFFMEIRGFKHFYLRQTFGGDLTFVHLIMNSEEKKKRLEKRHSEGTSAFMGIMEVDLK